MSNTELVAELTDICIRQAEIIKAQAFIIEQFGALDRVEEPLAAQTRLRVRGGEWDVSPGPGRANPPRPFWSIKQEENFCMSIREILTNGGGLLVVGMTLIQIAPVKVNPWSWLARAIGRAINAEVIKKLDDHITMDDKRTADGHRARILHFNNELLRDIGHTQEEFFEVLNEIDAYEEYCREHPEYPNNRAVLAIENIREVYKERLKKHDFLQVSSAPRQEAKP